MCLDSTDAHSVFYLSLSLSSSPLLLLFSVSTSLPLTFLPSSYLSPQEVNFCLTVVF